VKKPRKEVIANEGLDLNQQPLPIAW
jgi:hypothetical protein